MSTFPPAALPRSPWRWRGFRRKLLLSIGFVGSLIVGAALQSPSPVFIFATLGSCLSCLGAMFWTLQRDEHERRWEDFEAAFRNYAASEHSDEPS